MPSLYREWIDSFFARDIQRLFAFRDVNRFTALFEYVLRQSGGQLDRTRASTALGISRPTQSGVRARFPWAKPAAHLLGLSAKGELRRRNHEIHN